MKPIERLMPSISYIVARSSPGGVIGCENQLPWKLKTDMKFFRSVTQGHVVIMGRKTFESLGRPLPNRTNIVLSTEKGAHFENTIWVNTREMALYIADFYSIIAGKSEIFVIGGAQIYKVFDQLFTKIYLTEVFHHFPNGDAYFNTKFDLREWDVIQNQKHTASELDEFDFQILVMDKKRKYTRVRNISEFYVDNEVPQIKKDLPKLTKNLSSDTLGVEEQISLPFAKRVA